MSRLRRRIAGTRWRIAGSRGARVRALAGVVAALGVGAAAFAVLSTLAATHPKPQAHVAAGAFTTPSSSPATPSPSSPPPEPLPPRCRTSQLAMKMTSYGAYGSGDYPYLFLLRDNGPGACSLNGAPTISWPRGVEVSLQGGLVTYPPGNGGKGLSGQELGVLHGISHIGPVVLTPDGASAAFITVHSLSPPLFTQIDGPPVGGVKGGPWLCLDRGQSDQMSSWLYITLPGAVHSVAVPSTLFAPGAGCTSFGNTTAIYYPATVLAPNVQWDLPSLKAIPVSPIVLPAGIPFTG